MYKCYNGVLIRMLHFNLKLPLMSVFKAVTITKSIKKTDQQDYCSLELNWITKARNVSFDFEKHNI